MTNGEAVNWIINISADIGKAEHRDLWHYEQALSEIKEMLESQPERKKGKWIEIKHTFFHKCSQCSWLNDVDSGYDFCPRCGSYNGGEQE